LDDLEGYYMPSILYWRVTIGNNFVMAQCMSAKFCLQTRVVCGVHMG